jgi:hypothetical protein
VGLRASRACHGRLVQNNGRFSKSRLLVGRVASAMREAKATLQKKVLKKQAVANTKVEESLELCFCSLTWSSTCFLSAIILALSSWARLASWSALASWLASACSLAWTRRTCTSCPGIWLASNKQLRHPLATSLASPPPTRFGL